MRQKISKMYAVLEQNAIAKRLIDRTQGEFGAKIGIFGKVFGCWHKELSRPFTSKRVSYRVCTECGARTKFDISNFKTSGIFYYPPSVSARP